MVGRRVAIALVLALAGCGGAMGTTERTMGDPVILTEAGWTPANRARLEAFLGSLERDGRRVAVFDWDNTMMKGDIGDALFEHLLRHDAILAHPDRRLSESARFTAAATELVRTRCDAELEAGAYTTSRSPDCASVLRAIYNTSSTPDGAPAFTEPEPDVFHAPYAWLAQLLVGHTPAAVRTMAERAFEEASLRIYAPMRELVARLAERGVEVWIVSASPQHAVEPLAGRVGIAPERVIGIRQPLQDGRLAPGFVACGETEPVMTFDRGKRCFINQLIFGADTLARQPESERPIFVAGDSDTDLAMLEDATRVALLIDRGAPRVTRAARRHGWIVQPMFIDPLPPR